MITIDIRKVDQAIISKSSTILIRRNSQIIIDIAVMHDIPGIGFLKSKEAAEDVIGSENIDQVIVEGSRLFFYLKQTPMTFKNIELYRNHDLGLFQEGGDVIDPLSAPIPPEGSKVVTSMRDILHSMVPEDADCNPFSDDLQVMNIEAMKKSIRDAPVTYVNPKKEIHNNSHAFRDFLDSQGIEYKPNGHFTTVIGDIDFFELGMKYGELKRQAIIDAEKRKP